MGYLAVGLYLSDSNGNIDNTFILRGYLFSFA